MDSPKSKRPALPGGLDSEALVSTESERNSRSFHTKRKGVIKNFVAEMYRYVPRDLRILKMQFRGDPNSDIYGKWRARKLGRNAAALDDDANVYFTVATFCQDDTGWYRRRKEQFGGGVLLMIDDLGDGPGSKFPLSTIDSLPPTALIETSPDNFQAIYMFDRLVTDQAELKALIDTFVREKFLDKDTGMKGVTRVFRPPAGVNGKPKYGGDWRVRLAQWAPHYRYSVSEIVDAFGLELRAETPQRRRIVHHNVAGMRIDAFELVEQELYRLGMVRGKAPRGDWLDIYCPWEHEHSDGNRTGAAIVAPNPVNHWHGGFRCHHGHGDRKYTWGDLTDWLADEHAEVLAQINRTAPEGLENDR